jgi:glycosyltransferase involved in cell wall biosynthesis
MNLASLCAMNWKQQCAVVIPCYNEQQGLAKLLPKVRSHLATIIVIDDGSTDDTAAVAKTKGAILVSLPQNQGKGMALRAGCNLAKTLGFKWVLTMDGDGQHGPESIPDFLAHAQATNADLVIGNRMHSCQAMPWLRRKTNQVLSSHLSRLVGQSLPDTQCGYRLIRLEALAACELSTKRFEIESELLVQMALLGKRVEFIPVATIYKNEQSKIQPIRDSLRWFRWLFAIRRQIAAHGLTEERLKASQA